MRPRPLDVEAMVPARESDERDLLASYLPRLVVDWVTTTPSARHRAIDGTLAFLDISGFTKLSEKLARHGKIGAEELLATIGGCFVSLLDIAYDNGGRLLKFGGDALLLLFTGEEHERRACRAAFDMRRDLRASGNLSVLGQHVTLRMSVGINSGRFDMFLVGKSHRELIITGPAASSTVSMEAAANAGEILVSPSTASALTRSDLGSQKAGGWLLRRPPVSTSAMATPKDPVDVGIELELSACIPAAILGALRNTHREPEHRRVTVAFVHFDGTDAMLESEGPEAVGDYLEALVGDVQQAVDGQAVTFLGSDIDHDGGKLILVAGAPSSSGEDELRMLLALRSFMDVVRDPMIRVGVNRGAVFAGDIGPLYRRTFTVMGDTVNLAARLMSKATPGQILASPTVVALTRDAFHVSRVEPFHVKGKTKLIEALEVHEQVTVREGISHQSALVGRHSELMRWRTLVDRVQQGKGSVVEIVGEPGLGKSRLVEEFQALVGAAKILSTTCEYYESSTPYGALRNTMRLLLGLDGADGKRCTTSNLRTSLQMLDPLLVPWAPLVGAVVGIEMPDTDRTAELEAEFRAFQLGEVVANLLNHLLPGPTVLVLEDAHWMDESSAELLRHLIANIDDRPWLVVLTRRQAETGFIALGDDVERMRLSPLEPREAAELIELSTHERPLPRHEVQILVDRSGGNPLFLHELLSTAGNSENLESLPDSVDAVIAERIDALSAEDRHFVRRISVIGRSVSRDLLDSVLNEVPGLEDPIWERVDPFIAVDSSQNLTFRNSLLRDVAYDGLSYRLRRELHGRVAEAIAARDRPEEHAELLSMHYFHAQRFEEAWTYSMIAAQAASSIYANVEAAELFTRALAASKHLPHLSKQDIALLHEALGDARDRTGDYVRAIEQFRAARQLVRHDHLAQARLMLKLSRTQGWRARYSDALRWITRALTLLSDSKGVDADRQRAQLLAWYSRFCQEQGRHARAISWCHRAIDEAQRAGDKDALGNAYAVLDWAQMDLGTLEEPTNWLRGLALFEQLGDLSGQATLLNSLGMFEYFHGRWDEAQRYYERAQQLAQRVGNSVRLAFYENNIAEIALDQGRIDEAERLFELVSRTWRAAGYRSGAAYVQCNLARVATHRGEYDRAKRLFEESYREADAVGSQADCLEVGSRWAECQLLAGEDVEALARADAELEHARLMDGVAPQLPLLYRVRGAALARSGDRVAAADALRKSLDSARSRGVDYERALTLRVMAALQIDDEEHAAEDLDRESAQILKSLGVVKTLSPL